MTATTHSPDYDQALAAFMAYALSIQSAQPEDDLAASVFTVEPGRKYDRIVIANPHKSVFCFVDKSNGDILKSASWKNPARHARGTIYIANGTNVESYGVDKYGPHYMR